MTGARRVCCIYTKENNTEIVEQWGENKDWVVCVCRQAYCFPLCQVTRVVVFFIHTICSQCSEIGSKVDPALPALWDRVPIFH